MRISPSGANLIRPAPVFSSRPQKKSAGEGGAKQGCNSMTRLLIERIIAVPCGAGASAALHSIPFRCWLSCRMRLRMAGELPRDFSRTAKENSTRASSSFPSSCACYRGEDRALTLTPERKLNRTCRGDPAAHPGLHQAFRSCVRSPPIAWGKEHVRSGRPPSTRYTAVYYGNQAQTGIDCGCSHPS